MGGYVYAMEQRDFDTWLGGGGSGQTPVEAGRDLFENKLGCASCHQLNNQGRGPTLTGLFGKDQKLTTGQTVNFNEEYIRNSILNPQGQIVEGYQPIMPTFKGQVTEEQLVSLVSYIKSLSGNTGSGGGTTSGNTTSGTTGGASSSSTTVNTPNGATTSTNTVNPRRADRGESTNTQGSNPNAPKNESEPTNRQP